MKPGRSKPISMRDRALDRIDRMIDDLLLRIIAEAPRYLVSSIRDALNAAERRRTRKRGIALMASAAAVAAGSVAIGSHHGKSRRGNSLG